MSTSNRYVAKSVPPHWRVWDRRKKLWWGKHFAHYPEDLLHELNGEKRQDVIIRLCRSSFDRPTG